MSKRGAQREGKVNADSRRMELEPCACLEGKHGTRHWAIHAGPAAACSSSTPRPALPLICLQPFNLPYPCCGRPCASWPPHSSPFGSAAGSWCWPATPCPAAGVENGSECQPCDIKHQPCDTAG